MVLVWCVCVVGRGGVGGEGGSACLEAVLEGLWKRSRVSPCAARWVMCGGGQVVVVVVAGAVVCVWGAVVVLLCLKSQFF